MRFGRDIRVAMWTEFKINLVNVASLFPEWLAEIRAIQSEGLSLSQSLVPPYSFRRIRLWRASQMSLYWRTQERENVDSPCRFRFVDLTLNPCFPDNVALSELSCMSCWLICPSRVVVLMKTLRWPPDLAISLRHALLGTRRDCESLSGDTPEREESPLLLTRLLEMSCPAQGQKETPLRWLSSETYLLFSQLKVWFDYITKIFLSWGWSISLCLHTTINKSRGRLSLMA